MKNFRFKNVLGVTSLAVASVAVVSCSQNEEIAPIDADV